MTSKQYFIRFIYTIICLPFLSFAQKSEVVDFVSATTKAGIDIASIKNQSTISRYEVTRILNAVECKDCINPSSNFINTYNKDFWSNFSQLPGKDFDDIEFQGGVYKKKSYYYCVASVANNQYMFGYPILSSPACPGLFCGEKNTTNAEFIQVIINILSNYISKNYQADRDSIKKRKDGLVSGSYQDNILTSDDKKSIDLLASRCTGSSCIIENGKDFRTYLKYCMFNLQACNMQTMGWIQQGYWPVAEINIAYKEGLIDKINYLINNIHQPINGDYAISILSKTFPKISCTFDEDKDKDGISDNKDNCPNIYNPDQSDNNNNGLGDVCDDSKKDCDTKIDKDCDGIKDKDNCLLSTNPNQSDKNKNGIGDLCESDKDDCFIIKNPKQADKNKNGIADRCEFCPNDEDCDGIKDDKDNCRTIHNPNQEDKNNNGIGDICENDPKNCLKLFNPTAIDLNNNGIIDSCEHDKDNCIAIYNPDQSDNNNNGLGDVCDDSKKDCDTKIDKDCDGIKDKDNCLLSANPNQSDKNKNGIGDLCESDKDDCFIIKNPKQADKNKNGIADRCEFCPNDEDCDGIKDDKDNCRTIHNPNQEDKNNNGIGDICENDPKNCLKLFNPTAIDLNNNGIIDSCEHDKDNCITIYNPDQSDNNNNGIGDICENDDTDCDGIKNENDNCPNTYNPSQQDRNNDGIGDVCDEDIDGDGILNPIGIIDDLGGINTTLINSGIDNCLIEPNKDQKDKDKNGIGDICDLNNKGGLSIQSRIIGTGANRKIIATALSSGALGNLQWNVEYNGQKNIYKGNSILQNINNNGGSYSLMLQSTDDPSQKAQQIIVTQPYHNVSNAKINLSTSKQFLPFILESLLEGDGKGNLVTWELQGPNGLLEKIDSEKINKQGFVIKTPGDYIIKAIAKDGNTITAIAEKSFSVGIDNTAIYSIKNNINNIKINVPVSLAIVAPIKKRVINRGDGSETETFSKVTSHTYKKGGPVVLSSVATLLDGSIATEKQTIMIKDSSLDQEKILNTRPSALKRITNSSLYRSTDQKFNNKDILTNIYYNGTQYSEKESLSKLLFNDPGIYYPKQIKVLRKCEVVENQSTVVINNSNAFSCLLWSKLKIAAQCDMDKDGIDDRCDNDIDGDGITNLIGVITYNNYPSCSILEKNIDKSKLTYHLKKSCSLDNCPWNINDNQVDINNDGIGDICEEIIKIWSTNIVPTHQGSGGIDSDGDGIIDTLDLCPTVKENYNGYQDQDGCPEIGSGNPCETTNDNNYDIGIGDCRQCPCQYADDASDIKIGDKIRASLWNTGSDFLQSWSDTRLFQ